LYGKRKWDYNTILMKWQDTRIAKGKMWMSGGFDENIFDKD